MNSNSNRRRGRPPKSYETRSAQLSTRMRPALLDAVIAAADSAGRSIADELDLRLQYTLDQGLIFRVQVTTAAADQEPK